MLKLKKKTKTLKISNIGDSRFKDEPYLIINVLIAGIILLIIIYSGVFSVSGIGYPIKSETLQPTLSTGLSRAFSEIVRFNFSKARHFNPFSISIFLFFFIQFFIRILISLLLLSRKIKKNVLLFTDILASVLLFLWAFSKFIAIQLYLI